MLEWVGGWASEHAAHEELRAHTMVSDGFVSQRVSHCLTVTGRQAGRQAGGPASLTPAAPSFTHLLIPFRPFFPSQVRLFRGLRLKAGIDVGATKADLHAVSGRMGYRGRVMNRAARVGSTAKTGQVRFPHQTWSTPSTGMVLRVGEARLGLAKLG